MTFETDLGRVFDRFVKEETGSVLSLRNMSVQYGGISALQNVTFEIARHDTVAVIGPNGAGKSTLLNAICGIARGTGNLDFGNVEISSLPPWKIAGLGISRSFQDPALIDHYSVLENVLCGAHVRLKYRMYDQIFRRKLVTNRENEFVQRALIVLELVGLADQAQKEASSLPYGSRKLVDLARAIVSGPKLLLIDEPSSGLDKSQRQELETVLSTLRDQKLVTILMVEHHIDLVRTVATKVIAMQAGQVLMEGIPSEVLDSEAFRVAVVGTHEQSVESEASP